MDFIVVLLSLALGFLFISSFKNEISPYHIKILNYLFLYHIVFGLYNYFFLGSDPIRYWTIAKELTYADFLSYLTEKSGTYFMYALDYYPSKVLGLSYFSGSMFYTVIGFIGIAYYYISAIKLIPYNSKYKGYNLFPLLFFMPNMHFWTCTAGKDTICFFCGAIFCYAILNPFKRFGLIALALLLAYAVRPHIALFLVLGYGLAFALSNKLSVSQRYVFFLAFLIGSIIMLPSVMSYAKIEEVSLDSFNNYSSVKSGLLSRANVGSRIDISSYPLPLKLFTFIYRPLFFDINGIPSVLVSFENLFLLILSYKVFKKKPILAFKQAPLAIKGMMLYLIIGTFAFSQTLGNLGIIIRMRNMFLPGLLIFILWSFSFEKERMKRVSSVKM